jgi:hypothetical protein
MIDFPIGEKTHQRKVPQFMLDALEFFGMLSK